MARKPIHLTAANGYLETRDVVWAVIRALAPRGDFSVSDIEGACHSELGRRVNERTIRTYVYSLEKAGYLARVEATERDAKGRWPAARWHLAQDTGVEAPRLRKDGSPVTQGAVREQMWRTMRVLGEFTPSDLAVHASTEEHPVTLNDTKEYCRYLALAGYLRVASRGKPGNRGGGGELTRYRFLTPRYTGPKPPMIQRTKRVFDPNRGTVVWPKGGEA